MAYMNFQGYEGETIERPLDVVALMAPPRDLTALEWSVVALAQRDTLFSIKRPSRIAIAIASLFGVRRYSALADPRLEALRRMAVLAWRRGDKVPLTEVANFYAAGFSPGQYERLLEHVSRGRDGLLSPAREEPRLA